MAACATCNAENRAEQEEIALLAISGDISWRETARRIGLTHHNGLKNHMERHYAAAPSELDEVMSEVEAEIASTIRDLITQMRVAPVELKPLYATVIKNLEGLLGTQPSQQHLINALKSIHEITGMKIEQRMMLEFGAQMFGIKAPRADALETRAKELTS